MLTKVIKLHCLIAFTLWDIRQYMYCDCLFPRFWCLKRKIHYSFKEFAKSRAMRAYVPKACQHFIFTCQRANVRKGVPIFQLFYKRKTVSIIVNIFKFQEYLGNLEKYLAKQKIWNKIFWHLLVSPMHTTNLLRSYFRNKSTRKHSHKKRKETRSQ